MVLPSKLYKYRSLAHGKTRTNTTAIFATNQLWYARASTFNDPFDCNFDVLPKTEQEWQDQSNVAINATIDGLQRVGKRVFSSMAEKVSKQATNEQSLAGWLAKGLGALAARFSDTPSPESAGESQQKREWVINVSQKGRPTTLAAVFNPLWARQASEVKQEMDDGIGVLTLSAAPDNILLWSHYANNHSGVCLEFDIEHYPGAFRHLAPVHYQPDYPEIIDGFWAVVRLLVETKENESNVLLEMVDLLANEDLLAKYPEAKVFRDWFFVKSKYWCYEKEWRSLSDRPGLNSFPPEMLSGVIIGCVNTKANLALIRRLVKDRTRKVDIYVAEKTPGAFELNLVKVT